MENFLTTENIQGVLTIIAEDAKIVWSWTCIFLCEVYACLQWYFGEPQYVLYYQLLKQDALPPMLAYGTASGLDLFAKETVVIEPGEMKKVGSGVAAFLHQTHQTNHSSAYMIAARSSVSKTGLMLANGIGIIDRDYVGELMFAFRNVGSTSYEIKKGTAIGQLLAPNLQTIVEMIPVPNLDSFYKLKYGHKSIRGTGGFGSSGH